MAGQIFNLKAGADTVEFWSERRLPFGPTGDMKVALTSLQTALKGLQSQPSKAILATYSSLDCTKCDVDNLLICNVESPAFNGVADTAVRVERVRSAPARSPCGGQFPHHHRYSLGCLPPLRSDEAVGVLEFPLPQLSGSTLTHQVWWEASRAVAQYSDVIACPFELHISITNVRPYPNLTRFLKSLVDGIVSAMHIDRRLIPLTISRLASRIGCDPDEVRRRLVQPSAPLMGEADLLNLTTDFVQWNPDDHLCELCTIEQTVGEASRCRVQVWKR